MNLVADDRVLAQAEPIWAHAFADGEARAIALDEIADSDGLSWFHLNLADGWTRHWLAEVAPLPAGVAELMLSPDQHPRAMIEEGIVGLVVHDHERDFEAARIAQTSPLHIAIGPGWIITARQRPLCCADLVLAKIEAGARPDRPDAALDLLMGAIIGVAAEVCGELTDTIRASEDALLDEGRSPDARTIIGVRRRGLLLARQIAGIRAVFRRLEEDHALPPLLATIMGRLGQRLAALDHDIAAVQGNLRLLRDEVDLRAANRTNQNLYVLSLLTALVLPATLVTGFFGMNTGGLPWTQSPHGTLVGSLLGLGSSFGVYLWLRSRGFFEN